MTTVDKKQLIIEIYAGLFAKIWDKTSRIVGPMTVETLLETALFEVTQRHSLLSAAQLTPTGLDLSALEQEASDHSLVELKAALEDLVSTLFTAFTILTGDVITRQLRPDLTELRHRLEEV